MSACQTASPAPRFPIGLPFSTTLDMTLISGNSLLNGSPYGFGPGGSSSPKWRLKARSCGSERRCPRTRRTCRSRHASSIASASAWVSDLERSMPRASAPSGASKFRIDSAIWPSRAFVGSFEVRDSTAFTCWAAFLRISGLWPWSGQAPVVDSMCAAVGYRGDVLTFDLSSEGASKLPTRPTLGCLRLNGGSEGTEALFDHLVGADEERGRNCEAERLGGFQVDRHLKFGRLHDRQIGGLFTLENSPGVSTDLTIAVSKAHSVTDQATSRDELALRVDRGDHIACRQRNELIAPR